MKVWASGSGEAKFDVSIENGVAKLNLSFTLGNPSDPHYEPIYAAQQAPQHVPHDDLQYVPQQQASGRRRKGPARREKDRARAAAYQATRQMKVVATATDTAATVSVPLTVKLPFSGNLLPLEKKIVGTSPPVSQPPASSARTPTEVSSPPESYAAAVSASRPVKKDGRADLPHVMNPSSAMKRLFQGGQTLHPPPPAPKLSTHQNPALSRDNFRKKEDDQFHKLFS